VDLLVQGGECRAATTGDPGLALQLRFPVFCCMLTLASMLVNSVVAEGEPDFPSSLHPSPKIQSLLFGPTITNSSGSFLNSERN